ncbi:MAG TPA: YceI family protein [Solirubrobacteraceae bacterium]|nr:YceI family protein [Solirubrobacteraceae bacterium]
MNIATQTFEGVFDADVNHSSIEAEVRHMGVGSFRTRLEDVSARLVSDGAGVRLDGTAAVESISIRKPPEFREHVVNGEDFFDARNHPQIRFKSDRITLGEDGTIDLTGELTIKDITRPITATGSFRPPIEDPYGGVRAAIDLTATIDRRQFGLGWQAQLPNGGNVLGWDVTIDVHLELVRV